MTGLLLPAQAAFLLEPSSWSGGKCLQAALLTLAGRNHLRIGEKRGWFSSRALHLRDGDGASLPPHLASVKQALAGHGPGSVLRPRDAVRALRAAFGRDYRRYIHDRLAPELIGMGLVTREDRTWLGLIPYIRYRLTPSGARKAEPVKRLVAELGGMRGLIKSDPNRAVRLARSAGVLLVLSAEARRELDRLKKLADQQASGDGGSAYAAYEDESEGWQVGVEFGGFGLDADALTLFDSISGVGDFTGDGDGGGGDGDGGGGD